MKQMKIIKRSGEEKPFEAKKIETAIRKANGDVDGKDALSEGRIRLIVDEVQSVCESRDRAMTVEEIQDVVEDKLMELGSADIAKKYITYRYKRSLRRKTNTTDAELMALINGTNEDIKQENSNKNPKVISVQRDYMAGAVSKDLCRRYLYPKDVMEAHDEGAIHIHDMDYVISTVSNCELINLEDMLQNGTVISGNTIDRPKSFLTACTIATQISAQVASHTFGGQTISLAHLVPFIDVSRQKIRKELETELEGVKLSDKKMSEIVEARVRREVKAGVQTIQYQVSTIMCSNGQAPFISVMMYLGEAKNEQEKKDLAMLIEEVLNQRIQGVKNEVGVYVTPAFPKLLYVLTSENYTEGTPYWYLTELAAKCTAKRMVPDYISEKKMLEYKIDGKGRGNVYPCMGCVTGDEVIAYKVHGELRVCSFERMWSDLAPYYEVKVQPGRQKDLYIDLRDVEIYDNVNGWTECKRIIRNSDCKVLNVKLSNGRCVQCTPDHPFETENRGVVHAQDLKEDDIIRVDTTGTYFDKPEDMSDTTCPLEISDVPGTYYTYDVTTASEHFTVSGIYSHNCRAFLTPDNTGDGYGNVAKAKNYVPGESKYYGRFNMGACTLNLPYVALTAEHNLDTFWKNLDHYAELCHKAQQVRAGRLKGALSDVAPILWQHGAMARLNKGEKIDALLYKGYATISLGYAGLWECVFALIGKKLTEPEGEKLGLEIMQKLNEYTAKWKAAENMDYSLYGTPLESTTYKFAKSLQKRFGIVSGVSDRNYITNSYHVHVTEPIDAFKKLALESKFQKLSPGGAISYVEVPNMQNNIPAVLAIMKFIYDNIMYAELNTKSDYCQVCGFDGEIEIVKDESGKLIWKCPKCGNTDESKMNVVRRTCGYCGTQFWNQGRTQEIKERILHVS